MDSTRTAGRHVHAETPSQEISQFAGIIVLGGLLRKLFQSLQIAYSKLRTLLPVDARPVPPQRHDVVVLAVLTDTVVLGWPILPAQHGPLPSQTGRRRQRAGPADRRVGGRRGSSMFLEEGAEFSGGYLWVDAGGNPEQVEWVIGRPGRVVGAAADARVLRAGAVFV